MLCPAQVVAALDAVAALAADQSARGEGSEHQQPQDRSIEGRVDREAGPDWLPWQARPSAEQSPPLRHDERRVDDPGRPPACFVQPVRVSKTTPHGPSRSNRVRNERGPKGVVPLHDEAAVHCDPRNLPILTLNHGAAQRVTEPHQIPVG